MKAICTMYVTKTGALRFTKSRGRIKPGEVAFGVEINIPASVFVTPDRSITINVPEADTAPLAIEATAIEVWHDDGGMPSVPTLADVIERESPV